MDSAYTPPDDKPCCGACACGSADELSFEGRSCPSCGMKTIRGMRGSPDSICYNCGYKDPCCYD